MSTVRDDERCESCGALGPHDCPCKPGTEERFRTDDVLALRVFVIEFLSAAIPDDDGRTYRVSVTSELVDALRARAARWEP